MSKFKDLTGQRFGYLTALHVDKSRKGRHTYWLCMCDCGKTRSLQTHQLTSNRVTSCGCMNPRRKKSDLIKGNKRLYNIHTAMLSRCYKQSDISYKYYGGRGVVVCDEWKNSFASFLQWSIENGYAENLSIDRIDNSKGYSPDNCRWVTWAEQCRNKTNNVWIEHDGKNLIMSEWCRLLNFPVWLAKSRSKYAKSNGIPLTFSYIFAPKRTRV